MSLNTILSISESVGINDQRFVGQVVSRNQRISTSEILTVVPFAFDMKPMNYLLYSQNRSLLSSLRVPDKALEQYLNFGTTGWSNYIEYQGDMVSAQIEACEWQTSSANKVLVLGSLPSMSSSAYIVRTGDFCQVGRYAYIATADVVRGAGSTVNIPVHRNLITPLVSTVGAVIGEYGTTVALGGDTYIGTTFPVILREYPTYTLIPMTNDSYIQWSGSFRGFEAVL
ncbi:hypothetical protein UFOVP577_57 [uncultured Caudovirales phage]|uniref:Uncharacterized protein n=1 Tax=uncultured Caudovirales phage TaxID=2100421 RepID=A0A6J5N596_9CAUD|nr:hypothetical protein UFOVP577_57 [uncultured Caudovirales phage]